MREPPESVDRYIMGTPTMFSTPISLDRSARRLSSMALIGAAALAACDNDHTVGPNAARIPTDASPIAVVQGGTLSIIIYDQTGAAPTNVGAQITVAPPGGGPALFLVDNGPGDTDPTANRLRMVGLLGQYTVCQTVAPTDYVLPTPACKSVTVTAGGTAGLKFLDKTVGRLQWTVVDMNQVPVGGAVFTWNDGSGPVTLADNSALDLDKTPGKFEVKSPTGNSGVCPITAPPGWVFGGGNGCWGIPVPAGQTTFMIQFGIAPEYSVEWFAADPSTWGVGPSSYTVTNTAGFSATIDDDGKNDRWIALGSMWITLPTDGDYEICQTTPPPGTVLAKPTCVTVGVKYGQIANAGWFVSEWK